MSPAKHGYAGVTDRWTDRQTVDRKSDPYVSLCFAGNTKKRGHCVDIKRPFEATQSYLIDTQKYKKNCYLITAWFAHETNQ